MTQITVTFDEKFDLEEGELKIQCANIDDYGELDYSDTLQSGGYLGDGDIEVTIDNTGSVTVLIFDILYNLDYVGKYWQFQYWVNNEMVKSTRHIPVYELNENHTSGTPISISDVEKIVFKLNDDSVSGIEWDYNEETYEQIPGYAKIKIDVYDATKLYGYDNPSDYDLSNMLIQIYDYDGETPLKQVRFGDLEGPNEYGMYKLDGDYTSVYIEFVSPGVVSNRAELSESR